MRGRPALNGTAARTPAWHLFVPKLVTVLRHGYGAGDLRQDLLAGLTVAIVALPLSMALAIASGASPATGLHTAIIAGFLISALGGSRVQIGGPTAAFIPVVFNVIDKFGMDGLVIATLIAAAALAACGKKEEPAPAPAPAPVAVEPAAPAAPASEAAAAATDAASAAAADAGAAAQAATVAASAAGEAASAAK